jgi:hypothetical protein
LVVLPGLWLGKTTKPIKGITSLLTKVYLVTATFSMHFYKMAIKLLQIDFEVALLA